MTILLGNLVHLLDLSRFSDKSIEQISKLKKCGQICWATAAHRLLMIAGFRNPWILLNHHTRPMSVSSFPSALLLVSFPAQQQVDAWKKLGLQRPLHVHWLRSPFLKSVPATASCPRHVTNAISKLRRRFQTIQQAQQFPSRRNNKLLWCLKQTCPGKNPAKLQTVELCRHIYIYIISG